MTVKNIVDINEFVMRKDRKEGHSPLVIANSALDLMLKDIFDRMSYPHQRLYSLVLEEERCLGPPRHGDESHLDYIVSSKKRIASDYFPRHELEYVQMRMKFRKSKDPYGPPESV